MYDINFIRKSGILREEIARGKHNNTSRDKIFQCFEEILDPKPHVFNLETTNACNMKCIMCPRTTKMVRPVQWLNRELYPYILDQIVPHSEDNLDEFFNYIENKYGISESNFSENSFYFYISSRCLTLHGYGEPILDPNIVELVSMCTQRAIPTYFSMVPANIKLGKIKQLMSAGLETLKFSIDALNDKLAKDIRGEKNNFSSSLKKILEVIDYKKKHPELSTKIVVCMISLSPSEEQKEMERQFQELWKNEDIFSYIKSQDNRWFYEKDERLNAVDICTKEYCEYPWTSMTIMADGSVVPCTQDYDCEMVMGNVREQSLKEIWTGEKYRKFREMHITGEFPKGFKCVEGCDQILVVDRLNGISRTRRII